MFEKCKTCKCDTCSCQCQGCVSCIHAEYSEKSWEDLFLAECESYKSSNS